MHAQASNGSHLAISFRAQKFFFNSLISHPPCDRIEYNIYFFRVLTLPRIKLNVCINMLLNNKTHVVLNGKIKKNCETLKIIFINPTFSSSQNKSFWLTKVFMAISTFYYETA